MKNLKNSIAVCQTPSNPKYNEVFTVSRTYAETTPESVAFGVFSDTGFVYKNEKMTLKEVIRELESNYMYEPSCYPANEENRFWFSSEFTAVCYKTGTERQESLHIKCGDKNWKRLIRVLQYRNFI